MRRRVLSARRRYAYPLVLLLLLVAVPIAVAGTSTGGPSSKNLHGQFLNISNFFAPECQSVTGVCSRFTSQGVIKGEGVVFVDTFPTADGISKAHTVIHTRQGNLFCSEVAAFDLAGADHAFVDLCVISGGTGRYEGASGYFQEVGTFDFAANLGQARYYGMLILP
jgi:hypothetical protein